MKLNDIWHRITTTRYVLSLEDEVDRLREVERIKDEEIRALMNSLLTRAGVQPIDPRPPGERMQRRMSRYQRQQQIEREAINRAMKEVAKEDRDVAGQN